MNKNALTITSVIAEWLLRRRSPALIVMRSGLAVLVAAFAAGMAFDVSIPLQNGQFHFNFNSTEGTPAILLFAAAALGMLLVVAGVLWELIRYRAERKELNRKKVVVIEARGLRDTSGTPLLASVPAALLGRKESLLIDVRQRIRDGVLSDPIAAVEDSMSLPSDLRRRENGFDRSDITLLYGGLTPVPLTFLTGVLMDDEGQVIVMDWDRHLENWRALDGDDEVTASTSTDLTN